MDKQPKEQKPAKPEHFKDEREQRGAASTPAPAEQLGATEDNVAPLTPPTNATSSDTSASPAKPTSSEKQKAVDEIDPADELTPG